MNAPLLPQQCPACHARLVWMIFEMGGRWLYNCCFVGCCLQNLFNTARSILIQLPSSFLSIHLVSVHVVLTLPLHGKKKLPFILSDRSVIITSWTRRDYTMKLDNSASYWYFLNSSLDISFCRFGWKTGLCKFSSLLNHQTWTMQLVYMLSS